MAAEQQARQNGDAATLNSAKSYTDTRETVINQRTDGLIASEQQARESGDARTLSGARSYTDTRETAINKRTDKMMDAEQLARIEGDRQTLGSAKAYTDQRETAINSRTDSLVASEHDARIAGDANTLASAGNYTNQRFSELNDRVNRNERRANAGIAGAMALTNIPYLTKDVDNSFGMAIGTYRGETALAGGIQRQLSPRINARVSLTWDSSQAVGVAGGLAVGW
jgi:autotransporter adhesin